MHKDNGNDGTMSEETFFSPENNGVLIVLYDQRLKNDHIYI